MRIRRNLLPGLCALLLLAAPLAAQAPAAAKQAGATDVAQEGRKEGTAAARAEGAGMWTLTGFVGGTVLGPVGLGLTYALASSSASTLPEAVQEKVGSREPEYQLAFQQAYTQQLTDRRQTSALAGATAGTVVFVAGALAALVMMR
ncbi:MAG TPA: hypothetical protein VFL93_15640 [Longimicrobiaceae bacterium]|nr:hypothetical protein [Longimicrobiaceae bacterium]